MFKATGTNYDGNVFAECHKNQYNQNRWFIICQWLVNHWKENHELRTTSNDGRNKTEINWKGYNL